MSVIAEIRVPAHAFELGRILGMGSGTTVTLESMVPLGQKTVPFFWVYNDDIEVFEGTVEDHPSVTALRKVETHDDRTLFAIDWVIERDLVFEAIEETGAQLLSATGTAESWEFELRFPSHAALSGFNEYCADAQISVEVLRIYNPTKPDSGPWFGLTAPQRATLIRAVNGGYYSIPRRLSTEELAAEFDISDQAVTERLRRAIVTLVRNTLLTAEEDSEE
jgi:predicted DNA binding protein